MVQIPVQYNLPAPIFLMIQDFSQKSGKLHLFFRMITTDFMSGIKISTCDKNERACFLLIADIL
jgi:hypothetical protein